MKRVSYVTIAVAIGLLAFARSQAQSGEVFVRVNQVGYAADEGKVALALSSASLDGASFHVDRVSGERVYTGTVGVDRGTYGEFAHVYEMDLSSVREPGSYRLVVEDAASPAFAVGSDRYRDLLGLTLQFFRVQRCGDANALLHGPCHLTDGTADGGGRDGQRVDATGGWHDAGDYIKFLITQGASTALLLEAFDRHKDAFRGAEATPPVLDEARVGVDWIAKLWDDDTKTLYYQVGDGHDHNEWRLPEGDDAERPGRRVIACEPGAGANVAGKAAGVLALAAVIWSDASAPYRDDALAERYLAAARQIYAFGKSRPSAQSSTNGFYVEESWKDDMELAAVELYRATGESKYLKDARKLSKQVGAGGAFDWGELNPLAHYELARVDAKSRTRVAKFLAADLDAATVAASGDRFGLALMKYHWGSTTSVAGVALEALWYEDLTGDASYRRLALAQRNFILGENPWGVCFVSGAGETWPHTPHHQIADIEHAELTGFWDEGPVRRSVFEGQEITLRSSDAFAQFQSADAVYHDDVEDYVTNEPTLDAAAFGMAMASWFATE